MSITLLNAHKHKVTFSYCRKISNSQHEIHGWFCIDNGNTEELKENDYINLICNECKYNYRYDTKEKINIFTTINAHNLYFHRIGSKHLYTENGQQILIDNNYKLKDYYLIRNEYNGNVLIGNEEEIRDYLFSEMIKYKYLYEQEKSKNKNLKDDQNQKIKEINDLSSNIKKLNSKIENLNTKNINDKNEIKTLNQEINLIKEQNKKKLSSLNKEAISLKNEFLNKENKIKSEKNNLVQKIENTHLKNLQLQKENNELQKANDELKEKNNTLQNFGIKYNTENGKGDYDIILCVDSIKNLTNNGWIIKYNKKEGKLIYEESKHKKTIVVGVVGNGNKGKSFLLKKLSKYEIPMGFNVKTEGLSIIYGKTGKQNLAILDSAGQETPLLIQNKKDKNIEDEKKDNNKDQLEFEEYSRDKLITEFYIQRFILWKSNIIILLVGSITLSEQKLYARVKSEIMTIQENQKETKKLFVVHNLLNFYLKDDVNDYIENTLKKLYNVELEEIQMYDPNNEITGFDKYFLEKDNKNIIHLLFINDYCEYSSYYNKNTIWYLNKSIMSETSRQTFEILENSRDFLLEIAEEIMENKIKKEDIEIIFNKENEPDKLIVKNPKEIQLKKFIVDEMGITKNDGNTTKYSYYIDTQKSKLVINIELPGGGSFDDPKIIPTQGYYSFRFEGEQNGELIPKYNDVETKNSKQEDYEELDKDKLTTLILSKNLRKKHPIHIEFKISNQVMQIKYVDNEPEYTVECTTKGIIIFIFDIVLINKFSGDKKAKKKIKI
jgi:hypothetical protein